MDGRVMFEFCLAAAYVWQWMEQERKFSELETMRADDDGMTQYSCALSRADRQDLA
jgi:hypothetical protein